MTLKLYHHEKSQFCYKVRLALGLLNVPYDKVTIDLMRGEQHEGWFKKLNPQGKVPVIDDDGFVLWESNAILNYLANKYANVKHLLPEDLKKRMITLQWMNFESWTLARYTGQARFTTFFASPEEKARELPKAQELAGKAFGILNDELSRREWLAGDFTVADIACYANYAVAAEGGINLAPLPHLGAWARRIEKMPGYVGV